MNLLEKDRQVIWHPYTQHGLDQYPLPVKSARGAYLELEDGRQVIDAISSWWVNIHGHGKAELAEAIQKQAIELDHVLFAGFTHSPAVELATTIIQATTDRGADFSRVFYSDNGSTAVEVALKMAYQFHQNRGANGRQKFIALRGSYHGDTLGAMAVAEPKSFHATFQKLFPRVDFVRPDHLEDLQALLDQNAFAYAGFIFEPLIQGAEGMKTYSASFLQEAVSLCRKHGILTIGDEVFTGFYRTGKCFAFETAGVTPDLLCLSKGLSGGILPLGATLATEKVFEAFLSNGVRQALLHGHSYTGNPIACAAGIVSWKLLQKPECQAAIQVICKETKKHIAKLAEKKGVRAARCLGTIGAVELDRNTDYFSNSIKKEIVNRSLERGVLIRPLGNVLYAVPPYCVTQEELAKIYNVIGELCDA